jgi:hypothetical protein
MNKFLSLIAGGIVGFVLGTVFYYWPAICLISGPVVGNEILLPPELHKAVLGISAFWGGLFGLGIGLLGGWAMPVTLPRGHMSKSISCSCFLVCTIVAFVQHGHFLADMSAGRIAMTGLWVFMMLCMSIPMGGAISFVEGMRE